MSDQGLYLRVIAIISVEPRRTVHCHFGRSVVVHCHFRRNVGGSVGNRNRILPPGPNLRYHG